MSELKCVFTITRGTGLTESEKYLAELADRSFLRLWSYPNTYIDKRDGGKGNGKELADLLVVFGDDVIVFSDKAIVWPERSDLKLAWSRWYRRAVEKSAAQIRGAERWLKEFPKRVFLDADCTEPFPFELPPAERRKIHGVVVAVGATDACKRHFNDGSGTFMLVPDIKGNHHGDPAAASYMPFAIGDVAPDGSFVHVFDPTALDIVLAELDTVADFTEYLTKREALFRSNKLMICPGEEDLLALYLRSMGNNGAHDFVRPDGTPLQIGDKLVVEAGIYAWLKSQPEYKRKKHADAVSYSWDRLIDRFVTSVLEGTSVSLLGNMPTASLSEQALRIMARENRTARRMLGSVVHDALITARDARMDRFVRTILPGPDATNRRVAYVFLILTYPRNIALERGYESYREARTRMLTLHALNLFDQASEIDLVVGIGVDAAPEVTGLQGGSEDLVAMERPDWTEELRGQLKETRRLLEMKPLSEAGMRHISTTEFPAAPPEQITRQQRRAMERLQKKAQRRQT
jgi:hypothetical protein